MASFDFLGFTHYCSKSKKGKIRVKRKTSRSKFNKKLVEFNMWCKDNRTMPIEDIMNTVKRKLILDDINKANMFTTNNVVDTEFYLLFKEKDMDKIQKKIRNLIQAFANAGLVATQTSNDDLRIILDNFLNGGTTTTFGTVMS